MHKWQGCVRVVARVVLAVLIYLLVLPPMSALAQTSGTFSPTFQPQTVGVAQFMVSPSANSSDALIAQSPATVVASFPGIDTIQRGGLLWPEAAARLARTAYAVSERLERGQVILFLDHPVFRGWTLGTRRLFLNALLYGPGLGATPPAPW